MQIPTCTCIHMSDVFEWDLWGHEHKISKNHSTIYGPGENLLGKQNIIIEKCGIYCEKALLTFSWYVFSNYCIFSHA